MSEKSVQVAISGRVQGVGYRAWMARRAIDLGLKGWVRNRLDGSVEAVFWGPAEVVDTMIDLCRKGPRLAAVAKVEAMTIGVENWPDFSVRPTV